MVILNFTKFSPQIERGLFIVALKSMATKTLLQIEPLNGSNDQIGYEIMVNSHE